MIVNDAYAYIQIGLAIRLLRNVTSSYNAKIPRETLDTLTSKLQRAGFEVSLAAMQSATFGSMEEKLRALKDDETLSSELASTLADQSEILENVVFAEAITKRIYVLPTRRFSTEYLLTAPRNLLKDGAFDKLEEIAKTDFASSCRCILFGEATAAAFHILRATESVLKTYYYHHRRQNRLPKPMWGPMVDQLKAKTKNKPPASLLASLDLIRTAYRNPTQHPEAVYEIDSAQDLFGVCLDVIGKMTAEIGS